MHLLDPLYGRLLPAMSVRLTHVATLFTRQPSNARSRCCSRRWCLTSVTRLSGTRPCRRPKYSKSSTTTPIFTTPSPPSSQQGSSPAGQSDHWHCNMMTQYDVFLLYIALSFDDRDFVNLRHWRRKGSLLISSGRSVQHVDAPPNSKHVRWVHVAACNTLAQHPTASIKV